MFSIIFYLLCQKHKIQSSAMNEWQEVAVTAGSRNSLQHNYLAGWERLLWHGFWSRAVFGVTKIWHKMQKIYDRIPTTLRNISFHSINLEKGLGICAHKVLTLCSINLHCNSLLINDPSISHLLDSLFCLIGPNNWF